MREDCQETGDEAIRGEGQIDFSLGAARRNPVELAEVAFGHGDGEIEMADELAREQAGGLEGEGGIDVYVDRGLAKEDMHTFFVDLAADSEDGWTRILFVRGKADPGKVGGQLLAPVDISLQGVQEDYQNRLSDL